MDDSTSACWIGARALQARAWQPGYGPSRLQPDSHAPSSTDGRASVVIAERRL